MSGKNLCINCGEDKGYNKKFCSMECLKEYTKKKRAIESGTCVVCGGSRGYYNVKFCSIECMNRYRKEKRMEIFDVMNCEVCGKEFVYNKERFPNRKYCSRDCFRIVQYNYADLSIPFGRVLIYLRNNSKVERGCLSKIADVSPDVVMVAMMKAMQSGYKGERIDRN
jgi:hypothetical protein